jgi:formylglycine-generating enzyme required for sulfatase activity
MTLIGGGRFFMGSEERTEERPVHDVNVANFLLGTYEVTRAQWRQVATLRRVRRELSSPDHLTNVTEEVEDQLPIDHIQFREMQEFCERLKRHTGRPYRLPTEAEWEYACRAGTSTQYSFGDAISIEVSNADAHQKPVGVVVVGSKNAPNQFGIHDMHGNVIELTQDRAHPNYNGAPSDGSSWLSGGDSSKRVARGGMYLWKAERARSAARSFWNTSAASSGVGFRVALSASVRP